MSNQTNMFTVVKTHINDIPDAKLPEGLKLKRGQLYCPHCSNIVIFKKDAKLGVKRCPFCGISDRDYHVRAINKLWK